MGSSANFDEESSWLNVTRDATNRVNTTGRNAKPPNESPTKKTSEQASLIS